MGCPGCIQEYKICKGFPTIDISTCGTYVVDGKVWMGDGFVAAVQDVSICLAGWS